MEATEDDHSSFLEGIEQAVRKAVQQRSADLPMDHGRRLGPVGQVVQTVDDRGEEAIAESARIASYHW